MHFSRPSILTKELAVQDLPGVGKRLRLSTNFLGSFGFESDTRIRIDVNRGMGVIQPDPSGPMKVYSRRYPQRKNNPAESVIETANSDVMSALVKDGHDRLHFTLSQGRIEVRPVPRALFHIRKKFRAAESFQAFMALSSGLDAWAFRESGFQLGAVLEYRPREARDDTDLSETGLCTFLRNNHVTLAFNEDITTCDLDRVARLVEKRVGPVAVLSIGLQCDDFSLSKSANLKRTEIAAFRPSSRELSYYATKLIEKIGPAVVQIEQVPGWHGSESQGVMGAVLTRMGYHVQAVVLDSSEFGAYTARKRCYFVASIFPGYTFPVPSGRNTTPLRNILSGEIPSMADVSHTATIAAARGTSYERFASLDKTTAPTILKSQARCAKDSIYFEEGGRILRPTLQSLRMLHSIPNDLLLDTVSDEIATEQIGQGIEFPLHRAIASSIYEHLVLNSATAQRQFSFCN